MGQTPPAEETIDVEELSSEFQTWTDLATIYKFSDTFRYDGDYGVRGLLSTREWTQFYLRPSVRWRAKRLLALHGGIAWFHTNFTNVSDANELRPWAGVRVPWPRFGNWSFANYLRLEYRAFHLNEKGGWEVVWRGRYQLQLTTPDFEIGSVGGWYALAFFEFFHDFDSSVAGIVADRLRLNLGFGKAFDFGLNVLLNGMFQKVRLDGSNDSFEVQDQILRLRLFYRFN